MSSPFEMIDVPLTQEASGVLGGETTIGLPAEVLFGTVFRADRFVSVVRRPDGSPLLRLGRMRLELLLCLDPVSREVHDISDPNSAYAQRLPSVWEEYVTNTTLDQFVAIGRAISDRFPFYSRNPDVAQIGAAVDDIRAIVTGIDPPAGVPDTFWAVFADDVGMGDFPTEDVLPSIA